MSRGPSPRAAFQTLLAAAAALAVSLPQSAWAQKLRSSQSPDGKGVVVEVEPVRLSEPGLLEVVDGAGHVVRTLHGGRFRRGASFPLRADGGLPPGMYRVRYREGLKLMLDRDIKRPGAPDGKWFNPTDLAVVGRYLYVLESGLVNGDGSMLSTPTAAASPADTATLKQERSSFLYKLSRTGEADTRFGNDGRAALGQLAQYRTLAIDPKLGTIFMVLGGHGVHVLDARGAKTDQVIGGWDDKPDGPKGLGWPQSLAISPISNRIYILCGSYRNGKVYDRTKAGFKGIISRFDLPRSTGLDRAIAIDGKAAYIARGDHLIERFTDDGSSLVLAYASSPDLKLAFPTGFGTLPGLIWVACHGPGAGPYWDSGGGGEVALLHDDGASLSLVERYGFPGISAQGLEFLNPSAAIPSPDHTELYVVEDGTPNAEGPPGNARIRRFRVTAAAGKEIVVVLPKL